MWIHSAPKLFQRANFLIKWKVSTKRQICLQSFSFLNWWVPSFTPDFLFHKTGKYSSDYVKRCLVRPSLSHTGNIKSFPNSKYQPMRGSKTLSWSSIHLLILSKCWFSPVIVFLLISFLSATALFLGRSQSLVLEKSMTILWIHPSHKIASFCWVE